MSNSESIKSPCVDVCQLDDKDVCLGCFRSRNEIANWDSASQSRKKEIIEASEKRLKASHDNNLNDIESRVKNYIEDFAKDGVDSKKL